jgi:monoamine oxidase
VVLALPFSILRSSVDFQGYLNGAVETGQRAAQELLSA